MTKRKNLGNSNPAEYIYINKTRANAKKVIFDVEHKILPYKYNILQFIYRHLFSKVFYGTRNL